MITKSKQDVPHVTLIDFNVARKFLDKSSNKMLMISNTGT